MKHLLISLDQHQLLMVASEKQTSMNSAPIAIGKVHFSMIHWINWTRSTYQHRTFSWLFVYTQLWMGKKSFCSPLIERALPRTRRNLHTKWMSTGKKRFIYGINRDNRHDISIMSWRPVNFFHIREHWSRFYRGLLNAYNDRKDLH